MKILTLSAIIHQEADWFVAECPELGTASQGRTIEGAVANLREATELYVEEQPDPDFGRAEVSVLEWLAVA
jgi:predicted RNase H-like HicB family nuclease